MLSLRLCRALKILGKDYWLYILNPDKCARLQFEQYIFWPRLTSFTKIGYVGVYFAKIGCKSRMYSQIFSDFHGASCVLLRAGVSSDFNF